MCVNVQVDQMFLVHLLPNVKMCPSPSWREMCKAIGISKHRWEKLALLVPVSLSTIVPAVETPSIVKKESLKVVRCMGRECYYHLLVI